MLGLLKCLKASLEVNCMGPRVPSKGTLERFCFSMIGITVANTGSTAIPAVILFNTANNTPHIFVLASRIWIVGLSPGGGQTL